MKFNPNQRYTRWSIRRLSVGVASVVVASGFFVLVGQPSSARADVVNPTPAQVVPNDASVSEKGRLTSRGSQKSSRCSSSFGTVYYQQPPSKCGHHKLFRKSGTKLLKSQ